MELPNFQNKAFSEILAYAFSVIFYPVLVLPAGLISFLYFSTAQNFSYWMGIGALTSLLPILVFIIYFTQFKDVTTLERESRRPMYIFSTAMFTLTYSLYTFLQSPSAFQNLGLGFITGTVVYTKINSEIKISVHTGSIAAATALNFFTPLMPFFLAATALTSWSRLELGRHSLKEVVLGIVFGACLGALVLILPS